jgi:hypothetical protein
MTDNREIDGNGLTDLTAEHCMGLAIDGPETEYQITPSITL